MPTFRHGETPPAWCQLKAFEIIDLVPGETKARSSGHPKARLLCTLGTVQVIHPGGSTVLKENQFLDLHLLGAAPNWQAKSCSPAAQLVALQGTWGDEIAGCGVFRVANEEGATEAGDPVAYPKKTRVDAHYHDCDEFWLVLDGRGTVVVGDAAMQVRPGDCIPIGMGHHHDLPEVQEPVKAVFFETTLEGEKRVGHLWNHTHGQARPQPERI